MPYSTIQYSGEKLLLASIPTEGSPVHQVFRCHAVVLRPMTHYEPTTISAALNLALRARGLFKTSCFVGVSGLGVSIRKLAL